MNTEPMAPTSLLSDYEPGLFYDEIFGASGDPRPHYVRFFDELARMAPVPENFDQSREACESTAAWRTSAAPSARGYSDVAPRATDTTGTTAGGAHGLTHDGSSDS